MQNISERAIDLGGKYEILAISGVVSFSNGSIAVEVSDFA